MVTHIYGLFCCGYRFGRLGLQASSRWKWNIETFPILFEKVTFNGTSWGVWEIGKAFGRSFGARRCSIHSPNATTISFLRDLEGMGNTSINTYLVRFSIQILHRRITLSGVTEYRYHSNASPRCSGSPWLDIQHRSVQSLTFSNRDFDSSMFKIRYLLVN